MSASIQQQNSHPYQNFTVEGFAVTPTSNTIITPGPCAYHLYLCPKCTGGEWKYNHNNSCFVLRREIHRSDTHRTIIQHRTTHDETYCEKVGNALQQLALHHFDICPQWNGRPVFCPCSKSVECQQGEPQIRFGCCRYCGENFPALSGRALERRREIWNDLRADWKNRIFPASYYNPARMQRREEWMGDYENHMRLIDRSIANGNATPYPRTRFLYDPAARNGFFEDVSPSDVPIECPICLDDDDDGGGFVRLPCKTKRHVFHFICLKNWMGGPGTDSPRHDSCPTCREEWSLWRVPSWESPVFETRVERGERSEEVQIGGYVPFCQGLMDGTIHDEKEAEWEILDEEQNRENEVGIVERREGNRNREEVPRIHQPSVDELAVARIWEDDEPEPQQELIPRGQLIISTPIRMFSEDPENNNLYANPVARPPVGRDPRFSHQAWLDNRPSNSGFTSQNQNATATINQESIRPSQNREISPNRQGVVRPGHNGANNNLVNPPLVDNTRLTTGSRNTRFTNSRIQQASSTTFHPPTLYPQYSQQENPFLSPRFPVVPPPTSAERWEIMSRPKGRNPLNFYEADMPLARNWTEYHQFARPRFWILTNDAQRVYNPADVTDEVPILAEPPPPANGPWGTGVAYGQRIEFFNPLKFPGDGWQQLASRPKGPHPRLGPQAPLVPRAGNWDQYQASIPPANWEVSLDGLVYFDPYSPEHESVVLAAPEQTCRVPIGGENLMVSKGPGWIYCAQLRKEIEQYRQRGGLEQVRYLLGVLNHELAKQRRDGRLID
ncbi:hypothetical protein BJ875DRAFT_515765 [Amylocarpus encephaloides]|uniref:RING-type domain-containing protein n=1 Tax=Amylocarpus encephaloides TaxID=45428 RepID=A0A9P8C8P3_9HELO|nr:hypothetical protein BJ875DRAFT_515765 [Amylocarpus encephaloides]